MALGTLELEASAPYPTLITQTLVPPKDAWPVQQLMGGGIGGEAAGGGIEAEADDEARFLRRKSAILRFASATHN